MMKYFWIICMGLVFMACDIKNSNQEEDEQFIRIYSDALAERLYYPVDVHPMDDGGFLILSAIYDSSDLNFPKSHITKTDKLGAVEWSHFADNTLLSPAANLLEINGKLYYFAMRDNLDCILVEVDFSTKSSLYVQDINTHNPLHTIIDDDGNIVLLSFDMIGNRTFLQKFTPNFEEIWKSRFNAYLGSDYFVRYHLNKENTEMPFFISEIEPDYYAVNCFTNNGLSTAFFESNSGNMTGSLLGNTDEFNIDLGYSSLTQHGDSVITLTQFTNTSNHLYPNIQIDLSAFTHSTILGGNSVELSELEQYAKVKGFNDRFKDKNLTILACNTRSNQIKLYFLDPVTSQIVSTYPIGHTNALEVATIKRAKDESLIVLATTWLAGRYQRNMLIKIPVDALGL